MANRNSGSGPKGTRNSQITAPTTSSNEQNLQQDFLFIDSSSVEPKRKPYRGNRNVRSHVMQRARKERPWSTSRQNVKRELSQGSPGPQKDLVIAARNRSRKTLSQDTTFKKEESQQPSDEDLDVYGQVTRGGSPYLCPVCQSFDCVPGTTLCEPCHDRSSGLVQHEPLIDIALDPFNTLPVALTQETKGLWQYFFDKMCPEGIIPVDVHRQSDVLSAGLFSAAVASPVFMHGLLCSTALHRYFVGEGSIDSVIYHRQCTVSEINSNLNDPELSISDGTIAAVFLLLAVEEAIAGLPKLRRIRHQSPDEPNEQAMHLNGLKRMVELRGGLRALTTTRFVQSMILWHVTARAITSFEPPYISPLSCDAEAQITLPPGATTSHGQCMKNDLQRLGVNSGLGNFVDEIALLSSHLESWLTGETRILDPLELQNQASLLECALLQWLNDQHESERSSLDTTICLSLLAFVVRISEPNGRREPIQYRATKELRDALANVPAPAWSVAPGVLIWVLNIALLCTEHTKEHTWFLRRSAEVYRHRQFDFQSLLACLHAYPWVSYEIDEVIYRKWEEARSAAAEAPKPAGESSLHLLSPTRYVTLSKSDSGLGQTPFWSLWQTSTTSAETKFPSRIGPMPKMRH